MENIDMTQEEKELLIKDLCARLPYGVKVQNNSYRTASVNTIKGFDGNVFIMKETYESLNFNTNISTTKNVIGYIHKIKPYLRPMSSMTEEEKVQLSQYACIGEDLNGEFIDEVQRKDCAAYIDWLNKNMFDYRRLIEKGLALEAPEGMYNIKVE